MVYYSERYKKDIILSVKYDFIKQLINGRKRFEYRKKMPNRIINNIYFCCWKKIMCWANVSEIVKATPEELWEQTKEYSGIDRDTFFEYFKNRSVACAFKLQEVHKCKKPIHIRDCGLVRNPESFVYLDWNKLIENKKEGRFVRE